MAGEDHILHRGRGKIGRQIVLPLSKAFEIAWKSIRIRIWRSLITMIGIVLAIAFLMSVWTTGAITNALEKVSKDDPMYDIVQGALRRQAVFGESASIRIAVIGAESVVLPELKVLPQSIIRDYLQESEEFEPSLIGRFDEFMRSLRAEGNDENKPDALVVTSFPAPLATQDGIAAVQQFVNGGGTLVVFGYDQLWPEGVEDGAKEAFEALLPARPTQGEVHAEPGAIQPSGHREAARITWQAHPPASFRAAEPGRNSEALASVDGHGIAWLAKQGDGTVVWYPIAGTTAAYVKAIGWFRDGGLLVSSLRWGAGQKLLGGAGAIRNTWLVALSLLVCIVGIANAMLMSVTERFREIGTMKCLGALDKFIVRLFLIESSLQGAAGSIVGVVLGFLLAFVRGLFAYRITETPVDAPSAQAQTYWLALQYFPWLTVLLWVLVAVSVGTILSVVAAIYPAYRAAKMEPVEAMRVQA